MKLSTRAKYGLRLCFLIGVNPPPVSLPTLTRQTDLSQKYLEQILMLLRRNGIVGASRGPSGGYYLSEDAGGITIKRILDALGDGFEISDCVKGGCSDEYCPNRRIFTRIYEGINQILDNTTLQDMIDDYQCVKQR